MRLFNYFINVVTTFFNNVLGMSNTPPLAATDMAQYDNDVMAEGCNNSLSAFSHTTEVASDVFNEQPDTASHGDDAVNEEQGDPEVDVMTPIAPKATKTKNQALAVRAFVLEALRDNPILAGSIKQMAEDAGFTHRQLRHAADTLGIVRTKQAGRHGRWLWSLPSAKEGDSSGSSISTHVCADADVA